MARPITETEQTKQKTATSRWGWPIAKLSSMLDATFFPGAKYISMTATSLAYYLAQGGWTKSDTNPQNLFDNTRPEPPPSDIPPEVITKIDPINNVLTLLGISNIDPSLIGQGPTAIANTNTAQKITSSIWSYFTIRGAILLAASALLLGYKLITKTKDVRTQTPASWKHFLSYLTTIAGTFYIISEVLSGIHAAAPGYLSDIDSTLAWQNKTAGIQNQCDVTVNPYWDTVIALFIDDNCTDFSRLQMTSSSIGPYRNGMMSWMTSTIIVDGIVGASMLITLVAEIFPSIKGVLDRFSEQFIDRPFTLDDMVHKYSNALVEDETTHQQERSFGQHLKQFANTFFTLFMLGLPFIEAACFICLLAYPYNTKPQTACNTWSDWATGLNCDGVITSQTLPDTYAKISSRVTAENATHTVCERSIEIHNGNSIPLFNDTMNMDCSSQDMSSFSHAVFVIGLEIGPIYNTLVMGATGLLAASALLSVALQPLYEKYNNLRALKNMMTKKIHNAHIITRLSTALELWLIPPIYLGLLTQSLIHTQTIAPPGSNGILSDFLAAAGLLSTYAGAQISNAMPFTSFNDSFAKGENLATMSKAQLFCWTKMIYVVTAFRPVSIAALWLSSLVKRNTGQAPTREYRELADTDQVIVHVDAAESKNEEKEHKNKSWCSKVACFI